MYETIFKFRTAYETFFKTTKPSLVRYGTFFWTQKVSTLYNRSVCPASRLHDNSSKANLIVMKFCA